MGPAEWYAKGMPKRCNVEVKCTPSPQWVIDSGGPKQRCTPGGTPAERAKCDQPPGGCICDIVQLRQLPKSAQTEYLKRCPSCQAQYQRTEGLQYSPTAQGFLGAGVSAPDAITLRASPESKQIQPTQKTPNTAKPGIDSTSGSWRTGTTTTPAQKAGANVNSVRNTAGLGGIAGLFGSTVGSVIPGGGLITGVLGGLLGGGSSQCPGPFNYNPVTGGCDPKARSGLVATGTGGYGCPSGTSWDNATNSCKKTGIGGFVERTLPGGDTGYYSPTPTGEPWQSTQAFGTSGVVPQAETTQRLHCPAGYVLYGNKNGKNPGMEVCLPKGMVANKHRKWPKSPNPALSAQDMKTLRRIGTLQRKIKRVAGVAGFTTKKR